MNIRSLLFIFLFLFSSFAQASNTSTMIIIMASSNQSRNGSSGPDYKKECETLAATITPGTDPCAFVSDYTKYGLENGQPLSRAVCGRSTSDSYKSLAQELANAQKCDPHNFKLDPVIRQRISDEESLESWIVGSIFFLILGSFGGSLWWIHRKT